MKNELSLLFDLVSEMVMLFDDSEMRCNTEENKRIRVGPSLLAVQKHGSLDISQSL